MGNQQSAGTEKDLEDFPEKDRLYGYVNVKIS